MTQATIYSVPLVGPATPTAMAQRIDDNFDAIISGHSGASRPSYAVAGTVWEDTSVAGVVKYYHYDGSDDILLYTIDTTNNRVNQPPQAFASVASAATTDIGAVTSQNVTVTGTTTITAFGTAPAGTFRCLVFSGILTLTHNAASLILPNGGANIATAAGDSLQAVSLGSGNWRVTEYQKSDPTDVRAWVNFNGTGTVAIRSSKNVSSITDNGVGDYTVNFTTALSDANYAVSLAAPSGNGRSVFLYDGTFSSFNATMTASGFRVGFATNTGVFGDPSYLTAIVTR